jgi:lipopolysaccharide/colanic/teichoic acid biosynthesis glycosyltransferase
MYPFIKRFFDVCISILALLFLLPVLLPIAIALRFTGEGYIFYRQRRIGLHNQYFDILKFATMLKNSPNIGTGSITLRNDPRLLPMGKFLRMTKINELPQIINVLLGNMSWVGPRPLVDRTFNAYPEAIRHKVYQSKPGITGMGSVIFRDEEELISKATLPPHEFYEKVIAPHKGELEIWYNQHRGFWVDFLILFLTAWVVIFPKSKLTYRVFSDLPKRTHFKP